MELARFFEVSLDFDRTVRNPFVPHLSHFWHLTFPREYEFWLDLDNQFLPHYDVLLRLPGESSGSDKEVELAEKLGIPVFYDVDDVVSFFHK